MIVATFALILWPFLTLAFFVFLPIPSALVMSIIGGYLFLPEQVSFDLPLLPPLSKYTIPALSALCCVWWASSKTGKTGLVGLFPRRPVPIILSCVMLLGTIATVLTNGDTFFVQGLLVPGLPVSRIPPDSVAILVTLLPFFLARKYLGSSESQATALKTMISLGVVYAFLALFEVRMSPQLNNWLYGFFPHSWAQHVRAGGFRPTVFLNHGLWVSIFLAMTFLAAIGMIFQTKAEKKALFILAAICLYITLFLTKSLGAFVIANMLALLFLLPRRMTMLVLGAMVIFVLIYPLMRGAGLVPVEALLSLAERIDADRAGSLAFRFRHEFALLEHANERFLFGWGEFGRNQSAWIEEYGGFAVPDGRWVITMSARGYFGYLSEFGLLAVGILALIFNRHGSPKASVVTLTVALMTTANLIDMIPNGTLTVVTWFWAGALCGMMELKGSEHEQGEETPSQNESKPALRSPEYTRRDLGQSPYRRDLTKGHHR